jgi:CRISPR/Cas system-associated exonuclease Cas4 (RecB family)
LAFHHGLFHLKANPIQMANMNNGTLAHGRIQGAMVKSELVTEDQIEVLVKYSDPPILGYADCIIDMLGVRYLGEIKTTKHANFEYRRSTNIIADYHLAQMLIYMYILEINDGIIIYESKDTNELHPILLTMTDERRQWVEYVLEWCRNVYAMYQEDVLPAMSFRKNSKVCQSCPVESRCYNEPMGTIKVERLKLPV